MAEDNRIGEVRNRIEKVWLREDGIVQIVTLPGADYMLADAKQGIASVVQVSKGKRCPLLVDMRNIKSMDRTARQELAAYTGVTSVAVLVDSPVSRIIGNFFTAFNKSAVPLRLFSSEAEATEWLKGFLK